MRVAVYGGSFNPPHVGHLMVSAWLGWTDRADEVWWIPVRGHPFAKELAPFDVRVAWCRAVVAGLGHVAVSTVEEGLPTPSYTIDTLDHLASAHPEHTFRLVVGADVLGEVGRWRAWDRIEARYRPIVVGRGGWPCPPGAIVFPELSSTEIRARSERGEPIDHLVPAAILDQVRAHWAASGR